MRALAFKMAQSPQKNTPHETIKEVKPAYTLALEELIGLVKPTDDFTAVCETCRTLLNRYHRCSCEVKRIGSLVKSMDAATRVKRCARPTQTDQGMSENGSTSAVASFQQQARPQSQLQSQDAAQPAALPPDDGAETKKLVAVAPALHSHPVQPASTIKKCETSIKVEPQTQTQPTVQTSAGAALPKTLFTAAPALYSQLQQLQFQHLPQPAALPSDGAVRKKLVAIAPALHSRPVQPASTIQKCETSIKTEPQTQTPPTVQTSAGAALPKALFTAAPALYSQLQQLQFQHLPQPAALPSDGAVRKKLVAIAPALHSRPVQPASTIQKSETSIKVEPQIQTPPTVQTSAGAALPKTLFTAAPALYSQLQQLQFQHLPPPAALPSDGAVRKKLVAIAPALHSRPVQLIRKSVTSIKTEPQTQTQPTVQTSAGAALPKALFTAAPALYSQPRQDQLDGRGSVPERGQSAPLRPAPAEAKSSGPGASTLSASTRAPMRKQSKITVRTAKSLKSRIVKGPLEGVLTAIVNGRVNRLPHAIMSVPGLFDIVVQEVADVVKKECKKLTSIKFTSVLRQTTIKDLKEFKWMDVVAEWRTHAPTYLKFLESASSVSMDAATSRSRPIPHSKTNKYKIPMAGAILLNARCQSMTAHMYINAMVLHRGGARKRCLQRLSRLGVCVSDGRGLAKLKGNAQAWDGYSQFLQWEEEEENTPSRPADGAITLQLDTASDEDENESETRMSPEHGASIEIRLSGSEDEGEEDEGEEEEGEEEEGLEEEGEEEEEEEEPSDEDNVAGGEDVSGTGVPPQSVDQSVTSPGDLHPSVSPADPRAAAVVRPAGERKCLLGPCDAEGALQTLNAAAAQKIVAASKAKGDGLYRTLSGGDVLAHTPCYSNYTSSENQGQRKRKASQAHIGDVSKRLSRSECRDFEFKRDCLLCGSECAPKRSKNPHSWVGFRQCKPVERDGGVTLKRQLEHVCDERRDQWADEVAARLSGVIDLHAADAQYHVRCYNRFRAVPASRSSIMAPVEEALMAVVSTMAENMTETWTTAELYAMYLAASGTESRGELVSSVAAHFGEELVLIHMDDCVSVVGFKASLGKFIKIVKKSRSKGDDDK